MACLQALEAPERKSGRSSIGHDLRLAAIKEPRFTWRYTRDGLLEPLLEHCLPRMRNPKCLGNNMTEHRCEFDPS